MSTCSGCIKSGIVGGIILFIWSAISWMVLPWHMTTLNTFKDEKAVATVLTANAPQSGVYVLPMQEMQGNQPSTPMPFVFTSVHLEGMQASMVKPMVFALIGQIISAILVAWLLSKTMGLGYFRRVGFVVIFAVAAALLANLPYWNWFAFDTHYVLTMAADLVVGWFFAGLAMAFFYRR